MRKLALALLFAALAVPAFGETSPTVTVVRGAGSTGSDKPREPSAAPQTVTVCWIRVNSIGNMPYRHCADVERITVEFSPAEVSPAPSAAPPPAGQYSPPAGQY